MSYEIQRYNPARAKPHMRGWVQAYGLKKRTWPDANSDEDAIAKFKQDVARATTPMRLIRWRGGLGYSSSFEVIAANDLAFQQQPPSMD